MPKPTSRPSLQSDSSDVRRATPRLRTEPRALSTAATSVLSAVPREKHRDGRWLGLAAVTLSFVVVGLDSYIVVTALPTFSTKLHASTSQLQWITAAYTLAWAGLMLPVGKLGDKLGHCRVLTAGLVVFGVGSVIASQVSTANQLIGSRVVMGAGAAVIMPMGLAIIPLLFPAEGDRRRAVTVTTIGAVIAMPLGPLLGGWLLTNFAWGSIFLINVPIVVLALIGTSRFVPNSRDPATPRLDWLAALLAAFGIVGVVYAIIEQPVYGWNAQVLASLLLGAVLLGGFVLRQRVSTSPLIDLGLFRNRLFAWGTIAFALLSFAMTGVLFVLTPFLQIVQGHSAQGTGRRLLPMIAGLLLAAAGGEFCAARVGVKFVIPAGMLVSAAGLAVLAQVHAHSSYAIVALALATFGIGLGLSIPLAADAVLGTLAPHQRGMGNALSRTPQSVGVALGTAVLGSVLNSAYRNAIGAHLADLPSPARRTVTATVSGAHATASRLPSGHGQLLTQIANAAYAHGMAHAATVCIGLLVLGAVTCVTLLPSTRLNAAHHALTDTP